MEKRRLKMLLTCATIGCIATTSCFYGRHGNGPRDGSGPRCTGRRGPRMDGNGPYRDGSGPRCADRRGPRMDGNGPYQDGQGYGRNIRGYCLRETKQVFKNRLLLEKHFWFLLNYFFLS